VIDIGRGIESNRQFSSNFPGRGKRTPTIAIAMDVAKTTTTGSSDAGKNVSFSIVNILSQRPTVKKHQTPSR